MATDAAFATAMARLGPFEPAPLLAVAVSGGADSLALAVLADAWARARDGATIALVVDHGLRTAAAAEALASERLLTGRRAEDFFLANCEGLVQIARAKIFAIGIRVKLGTPAGIGDHLLRPHGRYQGRRRYSRHADQCVLHLTLLQNAR